MKVGSQATVNLDVLLKDAGLLLLTNDVKVSAANYSTHTAKERTPILVPDNIKIDLVFVIDTTNSMQKEIDGVVKALQKFLATVDPKQTLTAALVTFKDDVKVEAFTQDLTVLQSAVAKLYATGGGECPEASAEALEIALKHIKDAGTIIFATDASPYADADLSKLEQLIKDKKVKFQAFVTGDCSDTSHWNLPNSQ
jgi:predicted nucleic-acid-binding protein